MNRTILTGRYQQFKGRTMQWLGSLTKDRFYVINGRRVERDGEVLEAFGRFQDQRRGVESPRVYAPR